MNGYRYRMTAVALVTASFFLLLFSAFPVSTHQEVVILQNNTLIARNINVEQGLGAFSIMITYNPNTTSILNVSSVPPFIVVSNINNTAGISYISGFHGQIPGPTGDVRLVILQIKGSDNMNISIDELIDTSGKGIISPINDIQQTEKSYHEGGSIETPGIEPEGTLSSSPSTLPVEETPSPTVTPTPTATATVLATVAPSPAATPTATPTPTPKSRIPGFEATFAIAGLLAVAYLVLRRKKDKGGEK